MSLLQRRRSCINIAMIVLITFLIVLLAPLSLQSQSISHAIVKGCVLDDSTRSPLPLTNIFVSNSTIGAAADTQGRFELKGVPLGNQEIVASIVGYTPETKTLRLTDATVYNVEFRLKPRVVQMHGLQVEAKEPTEWKRNLRKFIRLFFGSSPNAEQCTLLNPEVLDFITYEDSGYLAATVREPLNIENRALGYRLQLFLDSFYAHYAEDASSQSAFQFIYRARFFPLVPKDENETIQWRENRRQTYYGSSAHFFSSLVEGKSEHEGFKIYSTWFKYVGQTRGKRVDPDTLLSTGGYVFERRLYFSGPLHIVYGGRETQESQITLSQPFAIVYTNGLLADPLSINTRGYWLSQRAADILPMDYSPDNDIIGATNDSLTVRTSHVSPQPATKTTVDIADSCLHSGNLLAAASLYERLANEQNAPRAFLGLANIALIKQDWLQARRHVDKALELDSSSFEAHFYAAIVYHESGRWRSPEKIGQAQGMSREGAYARSMECFHWMFERDSTYKDLLYQYALLMKDQERYGEAMGALCDEARLKPELPFLFAAIARLCRVAIDAGRGMDLVSQVRSPFGELESYVRAVMLRREGRVDEAEKMLWQFAGRSFKVPVQLGYRALLRIDASHGNVKKLEETYWKAVAAIHDEAGAALMFEDVKYILSPQEIADFFKSTLEQKRNRFFSSVWNRRNPTPGSPSNQRLQEHYQRLVYAEQNYSMDRERYSQSYSRGYLGFNFEFKDIGLVYIRLGSPTDMQVRTLPSTIETWHYDASAGSPAIILHFQGLDKNFGPMGAMGNGPGTFMGREDPNLTRGRHDATYQSEEEGEFENLLPPDLAYWDPNYFYLSRAKTEAEKFPLLNAIADESGRSIAAGLSSERHTVAKDIRLFSFPYVTSTFRGGASKDVMELAYAVPGSFLLKEAGDSVQSMNVESGFAIYDKRWNKVASVAETLQVSRLNSTPSSYYRFWQTLVKSDSYHVAVFARPLEAKLVAESERSVYAPDYGHLGLDMSDLQLALDIRKSDDHSIFDKEGLKVVVNPLARHVIGRPLYVYFEVYNATETSERTGNLDLDISLVSSQSKGGVLSMLLGLFAGEKKGYYVTSEAESWKSDKALAKYLVIDVTHMEPDEYVLQIRIMDRSTRRVLSRSVTFELLGPNPAHQ